MSASTYGRQVVVAAANKSGGGVIAGDVMVIDTTNNLAFTTTTSANSTLTIGVAQETIANNATGRILLEGYAALVNVNASVTRGHYGATFTVAKQATDAGAGRAAGTFCQFLTGGTTPDAIVYPTDLAGTALTNPMSAVGDIIQGTTAGAPARLAATAAGQVLTTAGTTTPLVYAYPPGYEFDYVQITSPVSLTATTEGTANTIVTGNAVTYDGSTVVMVNFFAPALVTPVGIDQYAMLWLYDGSSSIGRLATIVDQASTGTIGEAAPVYVSRRLTPSNAAHTYSIRGDVSGGTGSLSCGAGGLGNIMPAYIRIQKV